jgi:hypothetical protein
MSIIFSVFTMEPGLVALFYKKEYFFLFTGIVL